MPRPLATANRRQLTLFWYGATLGFVTLAAPLGMNMYVPALPEIATGLGTDAKSVQLSLVSFLVALASGQLLYGAVSDRFGRKRPLVAGLVLFVFASVGASLSLTVEQFIAWRFMQGLGACAAQVIPRAMVRDLHTGPAAARLMGFVLLVVSVAPLLAPLAGSGLMAILPWGSIFWFMAATSVAALVLVIVVLPETLPREQRRDGGFGQLIAGLAELLRHRQLILLTLTMAFGQAVFFAYLSGSSFVFLSLFALQPWQFSLAYAVAAAGWAGSAQTASMLMTRFGERRTALAAASVSAVTAVLLLVVAAAGALGIGILVVGVTVIFGAIGVLTPVLTVVALHPHGRSAGMASATIGMFTYAMGAVASALVGVLSNGTAVPMLGVMAGCSVAALIFCLAGLARR
jgi:DHA1 family bicyclomycin/chloramphenicol resistance-like MFS transporter